MIYTTKRKLKTEALSTGTEILEMPLFGQENKFPFFFSLFFRVKSTTFPFSWYFFSFVITSLFFIYFYFLRQSSKTVLHSVPSLLLYPNSNKNKTKLKIVVIYFWPYLSEEFLFQRISPTNWTHSRVISCCCRQSILLSSTSNVPGKKRYKNIVWTTWGFLCLMASFRLIEQPKHGITPAAH